MISTTSISIIESQRNHRAALGAYQLAKILLENHESGDTSEDRMLSPNQEHGVLLALEYITYSAYAVLEHQAMDAETVEVAR